MKLKGEPRQYLGSPYLMYRDGRVFSKAANRFLRCRIADGYEWYRGLKINGKIKKVSKSVLIASCYIPNQNHLPIVRHLNDDGLDNKIENLAWGTRRDNMLDAIKNGKWKNSMRRQIRGEEKFNAKLCEEDVRQIRALYVSGVDGVKLSKKYGVSNPIIYSILNKKTWTHVV